MLLANQLVASRIRTEALPPTPDLPAPIRVTTKAAVAENSPSITVAYRVHAYVNSTGKLYLIVDNPDKLRYKVLVVDQKDRTLYEELSNHDQYRRKLDLSPLAQDSYQVIVQIDNKPFIYKIKRQDSRFAYSIQPGSSSRKEASIEQNRENTKPLLMPVTIDL